MIRSTFLWFLRSFRATRSDALLCSAILRRSCFNSPFNQLQETHGSGFAETCGEHHPHQTDQRLQARMSGGPQWKPHARRAPWIRITFPRSGGELPVWGPAPDQVPPSGEWGFKGGTEELRSCLGYSGQDSWAVEEKRHPGQESSVSGRLKGRSHSGGEAEGREGLKPSHSWDVCQGMMCEYIRYSVAFLAFGRHHHKNR